MCVVCTPCLCACVLGVCVCRGPCVCVWCARRVCVCVGVCGGVCVFGKGVGGSKHKANWVGWNLVR